DYLRPFFCVSLPETHRHALNALYDMSEVHAHFSRFSNARTVFRCEGGMYQLCPRVANSESERLQRARLGQARAPRSPEQWGTWVPTKKQKTNVRLPLSP